MKIEFGKYAIAHRIENNKTNLYDIIRKKWIISTPEEEVRQLWLHFLTIDQQISSSHIGVEKGFRILNKLKRFDICIYNNALEPEILLELKAPSNQITSINLDQISTYNIALKCSKFIISNGVHTYGYVVKSGLFQEMKSFQEFIKI